MFAGTEATATTGICSNLPPIVPTAGGFTSTMESYIVSSDACGKGLVSFVLNKDTNEAIGAFLSRYYESANDASSCWDAAP